ncbi:uncharacterized protein LOC124299230 [Neodiprion virginianus]|uniref:uncharacterized protein LOC124299230 n=1 Tax=Neodiprion virginianus TaxID=2961670 RepID=UPI001EE7143B|nr:uncharacterized protein LOC124299230 [Neodiprion virginianus]
MTNAQMQAQFYLNEKKIFELFNFLIGHLLVDEPIDPIEYLYELLDKCMLFRAGLGEPPLLFTARHVESMFQSLDPGGLGSISLDQYKAGMTTLGIGCYDMNPKTCSAGRVDKQTFEDEAKKCLVSMLSEMIVKKS